MTTRASLPTAGLSLAASIGLAALSYYEHAYSCRPSSIINLFLLFSTLFDATRTRTLWLQGYNQPIANTSLVATVLKIVLLALETVEKRRGLRQPFKTLPPESTSGIFPRWIFSWQLPLFRAGYTKQLGIDDLFHLDKHLRSTYLQNLLQTAWRNCALFPNVLISHLLHVHLADCIDSLKEGQLCLALDAG